MGPLYAENIFLYYNLIRENMKNQFQLQGDRSIENLTIKVRYCINKSMNKDYIFMSDFTIEIPAYVKIISKIQAIVIDPKSISDTGEGILKLKNYN